MSRVVINYINQDDKAITLPVKKDEDVTIVLVGPSTTLSTGQAPENPDRSQDSEQVLEKEIIIELKEEGASAKILGIFIGHEGEMIVRTTQHHQAPDTTSDLLFKTILFDRGKFDYQGLIKIDKVAQNSNAYQRNDNLLIGDPSTTLSTGQAPQVYTKPILEIEANEVRCTHGATIGKLDEEQIYYLMTRGLSRSQAVEILLEGFLGEVIERIDDEAKREKVREIIFKELKKVNN